MKRVEKDVLTSNQFMFMLVGSMIAIGTLSLPNQLVKYAQQDAWISAFIGILYPLYVVFMAKLLQKKFPNKSILYINKKCFGKVIGNFFNLFIFLFFLLYLTSEISGLTYYIRIVIVHFLPAFKVYIVLTFLGAYTVCKGLKVLGRVNETIFYLTLFMSLLLVVGIFNGKLINIRPSLSSGYMNILKSSVDGTYQYAGMEIYLLIYPYVKEGKNLQSLAIKASFIVALIYTWLTFVTIYALGINIIPKYVYAVPVLAKHIQIPVINSFRFIFSVLWTLIVVNLISNYYYATVVSIKSFFLKASEKSICIAISPFVILLSAMYINNAIRSDFLSFIIPKITLAMLLYILLTVLIIFLRKEEEVE